MEMEDQEKEEKSKTPVEDNSVKSIEYAITLLNAFRWAVLFPVSFIIAHIIPYILVSCIYMTFDELGIQHEINTVMFIAGLSILVYGFIFVYIGTLIAPKYKKFTAYVMFALCFIVVCITAVRGHLISPISLFAGSALAAYLFPIKKSAKNELSK